MDFIDSHFYLFSAVVVAGGSLFFNGHTFLLWILVASILFLLSWSWLALTIAVFTSLVTFFLAIKIEQQNEKSRKKLFFIACITQLLPLLLIKFFPIEELVHYEKTVLMSGLIIGMSYYILQNLSYLIEVYRSNIKAEKKFTSYLLYTIYFPKVLLGPIENYSEFTNKITNRTKKKPWTFCAYLIALGLFKRLVISNRILELYNNVESSYPSTHKPFAIFWTAGIMTFMIVYCDFSSYMNIGRGISLLLGIDLKENFNQPYLAKNPMDYWQRWHISLGQWMRNYIFYPVLLKTKQNITAIVVTFIAVALWHGIRKELFIWALSWGFLQLAYLLYGLKFMSLFKSIPSRVKNFFAIFLTFNISALIGLFSLVLLFYKKELPDLSIFYDQTSVVIFKKHFFLLPLLFVLVAFETLERKKSSPLYYYVSLVLLVFLIAAFMSTNSYLFYYMRL